MTVPTNRKKRKKAWEKIPQYFHSFNDIWLVFKCLGMKVLLYWSDYKVLTEPKCNRYRQCSFSDIPYS